MTTHFRKDQAGYDAWRAEHVNGGYVNGGYVNGGYVISWADRDAEVTVARPTERRLGS